MTKNLLVELMVELRGFELLSSSHEKGLLNCAHTTADHVGINAKPRV